MPRLFEDVAMKLPSLSVGLIEVIRLTFFIKPSISPNFEINSNAVFGPIPGAPGILSILSPVSACI